MRHQSALFTGKKGQYAIEFYDQGDGSVLAKATGPIPSTPDIGWTSEVASAVGAPVNHVPSIATGHALGHEGRRC